MNQLKKGNVEIGLNRDGAHPYHVINHTVFCPGIVKFSKQDILDLRDILNEVLTPKPQEEKVGSCPEEESESKRLRDFLQQEGVLLSQKIAAYLEHLPAQGVVDPPKEPQEEEKCCVLQIFSEGNYHDENCHQTHPKEPSKRPSERIMEIVKSGKIPNTETWHNDLVGATVVYLDELHKDGKL